MTRRERCTVAADLAEVVGVTLDDPAHPRFDYRDGDEGISAAVYAGDYGVSIKLDVTPEIAALVLAVIAARSG
jgi:hypothetical protein